MYGYHSVLGAGWKSGVHDCRSLTYEHPWLVVDQKNQRVAGCWSREEARQTWNCWKSEVSEIHQAWLDAQAGYGDDHADLPDEFFE